MAKKFYAVKNGHIVGVFDNWAECSKQIDGFSGAMYKGFDTRKQAEDYLSTNEAVASEKIETEEEVLALLEDNEMIAYVDGSNLGDGSEFSWGIVIFSKEDGKVNLSGKSEDPKFIQYRNISGELFASVNAVNYALKKKTSKIYIYHDYSGIRHWALGEWKTKNDLSKVYREFFKKALKSIDVEFVKSKGHTGDVFNEEADLLAKQALGLRK